MPFAAVPAVPVGETEAAGVAGEVGETAAGGGELLGAAAAGAGGLCLGAAAGGLDAGFAAAEAAPAAPTGELLSV